MKQTLEALNHLTLPAALVICALIATLAWLSVKNEFVAMTVGFGFMIAVIRWLW